MTRAGRPEGRYDVPARRRPAAPASRGIADDCHHDRDYPGHANVRTLGQVFGVVVRSRGLGGNIIASLRSIIGGEIKEYTQLVEDTRRHAIDRMIGNAVAMGANAVVMMRFDSGELAQAMNEVVAYGNRRHHRSPDRLTDRRMTRPILIALAAGVALAAAYLGLRRSRRLADPHLRGAAAAWHGVRAGALSRRQGRPGRRQWRVTSERFVDDASGRLVTVWFNATTGKRRYVEDGEAPPQ